MTDDFFADINYSSANEDGRTERRALGEPLNGGRALCITGSGARALDLLVAEPECVVSIDFNPTQNHLLELKMAAMRAMEYEEYLAFLGLSACRRRRETYRRLRGALSAEARGFWNRHAMRIDRGVIYCGRWEGYLHTMARVFHSVKGDVIRGILESADLEEQSRRWQAATAGRGWRTLMRLVSLRSIWRHVVREPGIELIPNRVDVAAVIDRRLAAAARRHLFRDCAFGWLILTGRYGGDALPCHLERCHFDMIKQRLGAVRILTGPLHDHLQRTSDRYHAFSVSDFGSYAPPAAYRSIWRGMQRTAQPGARVCERLFLVPRAPDRIGGIAFARDAAAEASAAIHDRSFVYRFVVGAFA